MTRTQVLQERRMAKFLDLLDRWNRRELSLAEAGEMLGMSERQFRRYRGRYEEEGLDGLRDRRLGKASGRRAPAAEAARVLALYAERHAGWNVRHFHDHLRETADFRFGYTWLRLKLQGAGLVAKAKTRGAHRRKRERKPCPGMLLHQDASSFAWLADAAPLDLVVTMDDATSEIYSAFLVEEEGTVSSFRGLLETFLAKGLPASLYTDRGSHYFHTPEAGGKVDRTRPTQVGRALARLGVDHIPAYSPEARGRSERAFGTLQDRLAKDLALAGIGEVAVANRFIAQSWLPRHNARFATPPALAESGFVPVAAEVLREALCTEESRVVARDNTVLFGRRRLQLPPSPLRPHYVRAEVKVREYPDATLAIFHGPKCLARYSAEGRLLDPPTKNAA